jgi:isocitrate lyase
MTAKWESIDDESAAFLSEVRQIEAWWQTDRQKHIERLVKLANALLSDP